MPSAQTGAVPGTQPGRDPDILTAAEVADRLHIKYVQTVRDAAAAGIIPGRRPAMSGGSAGGRCTPQSPDPASRTARSWTPGSLPGGWARVSPTGGCGGRPPLRARRISCRGCGSAWNGGSPWKRSAPRSARRGGNPAAGLPGGPRC